MTMKTILLFGALSAFFLSSCTYDRIEVPPVKPVSINCDSVSYQRDVAPIISARCGSCHTASYISGDFTTYEPLKAVVDNGRFRQLVLVDKTMPTVEHLSQEELDVLTCWVNKGAPQN
ncbi:MAG: hypothetical protein FD123_1344 [Bacteroidetes bacterium]|nr:MAG: hypothetical protein FD123_1344 [Bacteroidota bacterium]